jgi:hypothetical protein
MVLRFNSLPGVFPKSGLHRFVNRQPGFVARVANLSQWRSSHATRMANIALISTVVSEHTGQC